MGAAQACSVPRMTRTDLSLGHQATSRMEAKTTDLQSKVRWG